MAVQDPHPLSLFTLVPLNDAAQAICEDSQNAHVARCVLDDKTGLPVTGLQIGFHINSGSKLTLATIGRDNADIFVAGPDYSRVQCSFQVHETTNAIMLQDRSCASTTQFHGPSAQPFSSKYPQRRVVMDENTNLRLGFGGSDCNKAQFQILWHSKASLVSDYLQLRICNPRKDPTVVDNDTIPPTRCVTRIHTSQREPQIRYVRHGYLDEGTFGLVFKTLNVDSGMFMALKEIELPDHQDPSFSRIKREVAVHRNACHPNIVKFLGAQKGEDGKTIEIFLELHQGNLCTLYKQEHFQEQERIKPVAHQMLQALDYLDTLRVIHRDIKPENILFTVQPDGAYLYVLSDFGLANGADLAMTYVGSPTFMAPEVIDGDQQTSKVDIWSLFVTLGSLLNLANFNELPTKLRKDVLKAVALMATEDALGQLAGMVNLDPKQRPSAAELLDRFFSGEGRVSPKKPVKPAALFGIERKSETSSNKFSINRTSTTGSTASSGIGRGKASSGKGKGKGKAVFDKGEGKSCITKLCHATEQWVAG